MRLRYADSEAVYTNLDYDENRFLISDTNGNQIECFPEIPVIKEYDPEKYEIIFLHNGRDDYSENSIYQVKVDSLGNDIRIGWIFPLQALFSKEHEYAENICFLKYAYVAYYKLLDRLSIKDDEATSMQPEMFELKEYYDDEIVLLVLDQDNVSKVPEFSLDTYVIDLYRKGYSFTGKGNLISKNIDKSETSIHLKKPSKVLIDYPIINEIFKDSIPREYDVEFARFYAYYQIIEVLITAVFNLKFTEFVGAIQENADKLFDRRDDLNTMVNEKHRVKWLFGEFTSVSSINEQILNDNCQKMLEHYEKKVHKTTAENFYAVRCLLVHELYLLKNETDTLLKAINDILIDILLEMIFSFKNPKKTEV